MYYHALTTPEGQRFLLECNIGEKEVCAWTVDTKEGMRNCARWGLKVCVTNDVTMFKEFRVEVSSGSLS